MQWTRTLPEWSFIGFDGGEREKGEEEKRGKKIEFWFSLSGWRSDQHNAHLHYWYRSRWISMRCRNSVIYPSMECRKAEIPCIWKWRRLCLDIEKKENERNEEEFFLQCQEGNLTSYSACLDSTLKSREWTSVVSEWNKLFPRMK